MIIKKFSYLLSLFIIFSILQFSNISLAGKVYMWTDENGMDHISDTPPPTGTEHESMKYNETPTHRSTYEQREIQNDNSYRNYIQPSKRPVTNTRSYPDTQSDYNQSMNAYYETQIEKLKLDKEDYKNKLSRPHTQSEYELYTKRIKKIEIDIKYYQSKIK